MYGVFGTATPNQIRHEPILSGALWICDAICSDGRHMYILTVQYFQLYGRMACDVSGYQPQLQLHLTIVVQIIVLLHIVQYYCSELCMQ